MGRDPRVKVRQHMDDFKGASRAAKMGGLVASGITFLGLYWWNLPIVLLGLYAQRNALEKMAKTAGHRCQTCGGSGIDR